ncbi:hypothetical protein CspeluHIS016_0103160 [Cutaneotrichosporon spelunceum]|uniref:CBM21 domain-containing protein n=1 Tax=Cutaneotrichosporon spelunceum TaxID=1672016 RepID=A0AAD3TN45_9TREE|nr:hypothetical protein CspeluHIS016_0103160 [Cutaneotrichosporon spelunceum]
MPYADPTSPTSPLSPLAEAQPKQARRRSLNNSLDFRPATTPMAGLPRRSSTSTVSATRASRKGTLSNSPRSPVKSMSLEALEAMSTAESLKSPPMNGAAYGGLGLKLRDCNSSDAPTGRPTPPTSPITYSTTSLLARQKRLSITSLPSPTEPPPQSPSPVRHRPSSDRMVRKKSGEMLKPALKNRSMSTPDLGRGGPQDVSSKSKSSHNLRERTKSVRFDDGELESVVLFLRSQRPNAVAKAVDEGYSPVDGDDEHERDLSDYVHFRTRRNGAPRGPGRADQTEFQLETCNAVPRVRLDFGPGTQGLLKDEYVVLERIEMCQPLGLRGSVLVRNIAFEKWVAVRFTLDDWQTISEVSASHASQIPAGTTGDEGWDRFRFNIKLEDYRRKLEDRKFQLCVRYNCNGGEWWDSNGGQNYQITFKEQVAGLKRPTSQFWSGSLTHGATTVATATLPRRHPSAGPRSWTFPQPAIPIARPDSPALSPPPQGAFRPPCAPDVHSYLRLKKYCAPSPPQSPPTKLQPAAGLEPIVLSLAPDRARAAPPPPMTLVHGRPATTWVPAELTANADDDVFATSESSSSEAGDNGDATPTAARARSPETEPMISSAAFVASPLTSPVTARAVDNGGAKIQRNASISGDLHSLASVDSSVGLMTPPSSNLSSPPTPAALLPPASPTTSMSTGDSSPVNTLNSATPDEIGVGQGVDHNGRTLNAVSYQEFIDKFCFFKSPPTNAKRLEEEYGGSYFPAITGSSCYNSFSMGSTTPPGAMTPTFDAFTMARATTPTNANIASPSGSTPRESPSRSPTATTYPLPWTPDEEPPAPSMAAA